MPLALKRRHAPEEIASPPESRQTSAALQLRRASVGVDMLSITRAASRARPVRHLGPALAFCASLGVHLCALTIVASLRIGAVPVQEPTTISTPRSVSVPTTYIIYTTDQLPGTMSGGGGGGNRSNEPIRRAESKGRDAITLRIARPAFRSSEIAPPVAATAPLPGLLLDARPLASGAHEFVGLPTGGVSSGSSTGSGSGGGVGSGIGTGIGPGRGPGIGEGAGGGIGGGVYRVGGSVTAPHVVEEVRPKYTTIALERRIQGTVVLELIVSADGVPTRIQVVQPLDPEGLDREAIAAVARWKFAPGRMNGRPVAVLVKVQLDFMIH